MATGENYFYPYLYFLLYIIQSAIILVFLHGVLVLSCVGVAGVHRRSAVGLDGVDTEANVQQLW